MEIRHLRYFEAVAATLNFSHAAQRLHVAQPALSRQIQQLESELGVQLLDRSTRPMALTDAGRFFYEQTGQILGRLHQTVESTRRISKGQRRRINIGFVPSMLYGLLPQLVHHFSRVHSDLDISLSELTSLQQVKALREGTVDLAFSRLELAYEGIHHQILDEEPLMVVLPLKSALVGKCRLSLRELLDEPLIVYPASPRPSFADEVLRHFQSRGYSVIQQLEANGLQTAIGLVAAGIGLTIVPASVQRMQRDDVLYRPLAGEGLNSIVVMSSRAHDTSPLLEELRGVIATAYQRLKKQREKASP